MSSETPTNFIRQIIDGDLASGKHTTVITRFPPEPNGYLHIGHAKSICLNFGLARDYQGRCHLRFDDTNPETEEMEFVESMQRDIQWLGFDWGEHLYHASDYFDTFYELAEGLIKKGLAYVDSQNEEEIRAGRGSVKEPGTHSPYRDRTVEENLDLFRRMAAGDFAEGAHVLRAKIDMSAANMKMRDPLLYRIRRAAHYRTGTKWSIYPMYDYAHCLEDAIEGVTHSICTLEFENNRDIYDWVIANVDLETEPRQYEMARLNLNYTVMSKRKLAQLVREGMVSGWDDPRMPTVAGMRRRGYTPEAIRDFCDRIGVAKANSTVDISQLESSVRNDLNGRAPRVMGVLDPLKLVITNYPEGQVEELDADYFPHDVPKDGSRKLPFGREIYIERADFMEDPPKKYNRLAPGREVRLRHAYTVRCDAVIKNEAGAITELHCTYDAGTLGVNPDRKVWGVIHWLEVSRAVSAEVRLYDRLFNHEAPDGDKEVDFKTHLNPDSLKVITAFVEPSVVNDAPGSLYQFERQGYFCSDPVTSTAEKLVFNRTVGLRDTWAKQSEPAPAAAKPATPKVKPAPAKAVPAAADRSRDAAAQARYETFTQTLKLNEEIADTLAAEPKRAAFFEAALAVHNNARDLANRIANDLPRDLFEGDGPPFAPADMAALVKLSDDGVISGRAAKDVLGEMLAGGGAPDVIVEKLGLSQVSDEGELLPIIDDLIAKNPDKVQRYRDGNKKMTGFFVGQIMKATGGRANPKLVNQLLAKKLS